MREDVRRGTHEDLERDLWRKFRASGFRFVGLTCHPRTLNKSELNPKP